MLDIDSLLPKVNKDDVANIIFPWSDKPIAFTAYARNAIYHVAKKNKSINPYKTTALVPSYSCGDEIEPLVKAGYNIKVYPVNSTLSVQLKDIIDNITKRTGIVILTHYFGQQQNEINSIYDFCNSRQILLVEDCAQAMNAKYSKSRRVGSTGHVAIFSLRKFFQIPHGAAVIFNNAPDLQDISFSPMPKEALNFDLYVFLGRSLGILKPGTPTTKINETLGLTSKSTHGPRLEKWGGYDLNASQLALNTLLHQEINTILDSRLKNYMRLHNLLSAYKPNLLLIKEPLQTTVSPFFPIKTDSSVEIDKRLKQEDKIYITQPYWSYLHKYIPWHVYTHARDLKQQVLAIDTRYRIDEKEFVSMLTKI